jgi:hypothetical protein
MQTLQATSAKMELEVISFTEIGFPTTFRIVDQEGTLIAKVNGKGNVPVAEKICKAFNNCDKMQSLLRNRLFEILKQLKGSGQVSWMIREAMKKENMEPLLKFLQDQSKVAPIELTGIIGGEAMQILEIL